eukprot:1975925-Amphidinium_carterae.1
MASAHTTRHYKRSNFRVFNFSSTDRKTTDDRVGKPDEPKLLSLEIDQSGSAKHFQQTKMRTTGREKT